MASQEDPSGDNAAMATVAAAIEQAIETDLFAAIGELFAETVTWGDCAGKRDARSFLDQAADAAPPIAGGSVITADDRLLVAIRFDSPIDGHVRREIHSAVFVADGQITEIVDAADAQHAASLAPVGPLPEAADRAATIGSLAPVLPVADVAAAAAHYRALGFDVEAYDGPAAYAFARRDGIELHLAGVSEVDPKTNMSAVYLFVDDADALYATWRLAELGGRLIPPSDTDYGLREGAHLDLDGNLLRFGSPIGD